MPAGFAICNSESTSFHFHDLTTREWIPMQNLPNGRLRYGETFTAVVLFRYLYILKKDKSVYRIKYSDMKADWERMPDMNEDHGWRPPAIVVNGILYVFGGGGNTESEKFNPTTNKWEKIKSMPVRKLFHSLAATADFIYSIGGQYDDGKPMKSVEGFSLKGVGAWHKMAELKQARYDAAAVEVKGILYVLGGKENNNGKLLSSVESYNPSKNMWASFSSMTFPRAGFNAFVIEDKIYAVDGYAWEPSIEVLIPDTNDKYFINNGKFEGIFAAVPMSSSPKDLSIESVKAMKKKDGFLIQWTKLPDPITEYFLQVYCDDEFHDPITFFNKTHYFLRNPEPSKKYVFHVWFRDRFRVGQKVKSNMIISYRSTKVDENVYCDTTYQLRKDYKVYIGEIDDSNGDPQDVAVKLMEYKPETVREIETMRKIIEHRNTVIYKQSGAMGGLTGTNMYLAMELCESKTLNEIIKDEQPSFERRKEIVQQIAHGLWHIHSKGIIHRDLKPQNVLRSLDRRNMKLADFGLCKEIDLEKSKATKSMNEIGTDGWGSPEHYSGGKMSKKSDIYSAGLLFYFVLSNGKHVFGPDNFTWKISIIEGKPFRLDGLKCQNVHYAKDLIAKMLQVRPENRITISEVLRHPFMEYMK